VASFSFETPCTADALHAAYEQRAASAAPGSDNDWRRDHLGASIIGHKCDRYLWQSFRWAADPKHTGKMLRLFDRGSREEAWIVDDLRAAGITVLDRDPNTCEQFRVSLAPHVGGGLDGIVSGLIESDGDHVLEVKTHNAKSFGRLQEKRVKSAKPEHWAQMQAYMLGRGIERAFYIAVCKDNDEIYTEIVKLDRKTAESIVERARGVVESNVPAVRMDRESPPCVYVSQDGKRWPCQFFDLCHGTKMPERNCRTCLSSTPREDGTWFCEHRDEVLDGLAQRRGCADHLTIPQMVNASVSRVEVRRITYQFADGSVVKDGVTQ